MKLFKENYAVILAFALPIILILGILITTRTPTLSVQPQHDFLYAMCGDSTGPYRYNCISYLNSLYAVENKKLIVKEISPEQDADFNNIKDVNENYSPRIFIHNVTINESREITFEEASQLSLSPLLTSPDGIAVENIYDQGPEFFPFFNNGSSHGYYLTKGKGKQKLNLIGDHDRYYYADNFKFIGWVEK